MQQGIVQQRLSRRSALGLLATAAGSAWLAACVPSAPTAPAAPAASTSSPPAAAQPKAGGTLRMGIPGDLATLDGHLTQGLTGFDTLWQVFDRLTAYDAKLQP